jgi:hypothetical protein
MTDQPSLQQETSTRTGRRLWMVTLGVAALLILITIIFLVVGKHLGLPQ